MLSNLNIFSVLVASSSLLPSLATAAAPQVPNPVDPKNVMVPWSKDPVECFPTYACANDCATAYKDLCNQITAKNKPAPDPKKLDVQRVVSGSCLAYHHLGKGNKPFADTDSCQLAFAQIVSKSQTPDAQKCGRIAGAMGYDASGNRLASPLFALMSADGNPNCFKMPGDKTPVPAYDKLPDGSPLMTCPETATSKRRDLVVRKVPVDDLSGKQILKCGAEDAVVLTGCSATCLMTVLATSWLTGPLAFAAGLGCVGLCDAVALKTADNCLESEGSDLFKNYFDWNKKRDAPVMGLDARAAPDASTNKCLRLSKWNVCNADSTRALQKNLGCSTGTATVNT